MTFIGKVSGLKAASLHAQYLEEYTLMAGHLKRLYVVTDTVEEKTDANVYNLRIIKLPSIKIPKIYGFTKIILYILASALLSKNYDLLYVRTFSPPELMALWFCARILKKPTALVLPGTWLFGRPDEVPTGKVRVFRLILKLAMYSASRIILYSWRMLPEAVKYAPSLDVHRITVVRNAVNIERFRKGLDRSEAVKKIAGEEPYIYYVGRLNEKKGVLDLVDAYSIVAEKLENCPKLLLFGDGVAEFIQRLRNKIKQKKLSDKVIVAGPIPNMEVPSLAANSLFIVYATREGEGIPRAIVEAMACGRPAVATEVAGIPDLVRDGETGYLVKPRDVNALADKILTLIIDQVKREKMGENARQLVEKEFSYNTVIPKITTLLKELVDSRR
ncbi:MAG: glycosyltransferase [Thermoproteota archaeon]